MARSNCRHVFCPAGCAALTVELYTALIKATFSCYNIILGPTAEMLLSMISVPFQRTSTTVRCKDIRELRKQFFFSETEIVVGTFRTGCIRGVLSGLSVRPRGEALSGRFRTRRPVSLNAFKSEGFELLGAKTADLRQDEINYQRTPTVPTIIRCGCALELCYF